MPSVEIKIFLRKLVKAPLFIRAVGTLFYIAIFIGLVLTGGVPLLVGVTILAAIAAFEFYRIMHFAGFHPPYAVGIVLAAIFPISAFFKYNVFSQTITLAMIFTVLGLGIAGLYQRNTNADTLRNPILEWSCALIGAIYTGVFLAHAILIRNLPDGTILLLLVVFGAAACDSGAYLIGKSLGRHPFFQRISPRKTLEGAIGGIVSSILVILITSYLLQADLNYLQSAVLGVLVGVSVVFGDLVESWFKRTGGVKDSGSWIPEQGGLLDVVDGFLVAILVSYYFYTLVVL